MNFLYLLILGTKCIFILPYSFSSPSFMYYLGTLSISPVFYQWYFDYIPIIFLKNLSKRVFCLQHHHWRWCWVVQYLYRAPGLMEHWSSSFWKLSCSENILKISIKFPFYLVLFYFLLGYIRIFGIIFKPF